MVSIHIRNDKKIIFYPFILLHMILTSVWLEIHATFMDSSFAEASPTNLSDLVWGSCVAVVQHACMCEYNTHMWLSPLAQRSQENSYLLVTQSVQAEGVTHWNLTSDYIKTKVSQRSTKFLYTHTHTYACIRLALFVLWNYQTCDNDSMLIINQEVNNSICLLCEW